MTIRLVSGQYMNHLARPNVTITFNPAADSKFPASALGDNASDLIALFGSSPLDGTITADLNLMANGGFEANGTSPPSSWGVIAGGATISITTVGAEVHSGTRAVKIDATLGGGGVATTQVYQGIQCRAGEVLHFDGWYRSGGSGKIAYIYIWNPETNHYYNPGLDNWAANVVAVASTTSTSYQHMGGLWVPVEGYDFDTYSGIQNPTTTVYVIVTAEAGGVGFFDDFSAWPETDWCSVHGHNLSTSITPQWRDSTDNFSGSDSLLTALVACQPSFGAWRVSNQQSVNRYQRLKLVGRNAAAPYLCEWVLSQQLTGPPLAFPQAAQLPLQRNFKYPWATTYVYPQVRSRNATGAKRSYALTTQPRRPLSIAFDWPNADAFREAITEIFQRTYGGHHPMAVFPDDANLRDVRFGYVTDQWGPVTTEFVNRYSAGIDFEEEPFPGIVA